jgi:hypothetical protein
MTIEAAKNLSVFRLGKYSDVEGNVLLAMGIKME